MHSRFPSCFGGNAGCLIIAAIRGSFKKTDGPLAVSLFPGAK
jgi:hypothetical protein